MLGIPSYTNSVLRDRVALWILGISTLLRMITATAIGPGFDEAYYFLFALHPAWGYFDHPPLVAFTAGIGHALTGIWSPLTLRLGAILFGTLALAGIYTFTAMLFGSRSARIVLLVVHASPYFTVGAGAFLLPDNGLVAAWSWALVMTVALRDDSATKRTMLFAVLGVLLGIALLAKYHALLLVASFIVASLYDRKFQSWWRDWRHYMAMVIALLLFLPVILWNADNGWISFAEQFGKTGSGGLRIRFDLLGQAIGGQLGYLTPWLGILLWIVMFRKRVVARTPRWMLPFFLLPIVLLTLIGLTRTILPHWTMPGYIIAFAPLARWMTTWIKQKWALPAMIVANGLLIAFVVLQAHTGVVPLGAKADPTLDSEGWEQAVTWLEEERLLDEDDVLFAHKWFTAGEIAWAVRGERRVVLIGNRPHNFTWWAPEVGYMSSSGYLITQDRYRVDRKDLEERFETVSELEALEIMRGKTRMKMHIWRLENLNQPVPAPYGPIAKASN